MWYPETEDVENANKMAVDKFRATKAEKFKVLSREKINEALNICKKRKGSIERKSACLLKAFSDPKRHCFASANRRTAYILMNEFLWKNAGYSIAKKRTFTQELFKELRRRDVSEDEILKWYGAKYGSN